MYFNYLCNLNKLNFFTHIRLTSVFSSVQTIFRVVIKCISYEVFSHDCRSFDSFCFARLLETFLLTIMHISFKEFVCLVETTINLTIFVIKTAFLIYNGKCLVAFAMNGQVRGQGLPKKMQLNSSVF